MISKDLEVQYCNISNFPKERGLLHDISDLESSLYIYILTSPMTHRFTTLRLLLFHHGLHFLFNHPKCSLAKGLENKQENGQENS
ncbi:MAG: hypothetical protein CL912_18590 [Deltaproteobacteria bacterium]|nr:hypothetical protein [Deltaproteobacteria bacterium]